MSSITKQPNLELINTIYKNYNFTVMTTIGIVNNIHSSILIDTELSISIINEQLYNQINQNNNQLKLLPWDCDLLVAANNGQLTTLGKYIVELKIGSRTGNK